MTEREIEGVLPHYEGLIFSTTRIVVEAGVEEEFEDLQQIFRMKLVKALRAYNPRRSRLARDAFIFGAIANQKKDMLKRKRRNEGSVEELADAYSTEDRFALEHGLVTSPDEIYAAIEDDDLMLPSTLSAIERQIVVRLYAGRMQIEAAAELGLTKGETERAMRSIRVKLADWRPSGEREHVPTPPLPRAPSRAPRPSVARSS